MFGCGTLGYHTIIRLILMDAGRVVIVNRIKSRLR